MNPIPDILDTVDCIGLDSFNKPVTGWVVTGYYQKVYDKFNFAQKEFESVDWEICHELLAQERLAEYYKRLEAGLPTNAKYRYAPCYRYEATHLRVGRECGSMIVPLPVGRIESEYKCNIKTIALKKRDWYSYVYRDKHHRWWPIDWEWE